MKSKQYFLESITTLLVFLLLSICAQAAPAANNGKYLMYVGTYTQEGSTSKGIYVYRYDAAAGNLTAIGLAAASVNPSYLAIDPSHRFLYAVNETQQYKGKKNSGAVSAYAVDRATGRLTLLNEVATGGADPCYIAVDKTGKYVLVANYTAGSIAVFPVLLDGRLGEASTFIQHSGKGTNPARQEGPHAHSIDVSPDNHFAIVDDLGLDETLVYKFSGSTAAAPDQQLAYASMAKAAPGAGPRHFAFHSNGKFGYVINEMASTVSVFSYDPETGALHQLQTISTLPKDFTKENTAAEIEVHPSGKFLYASNRGHDSIAVFAIDPDKGTLTLVEYASTKGQGPRNFEIDPTGTRLFAANEKADNIVEFRINPQTGRLTPTGKVLELSQPVCVRFVPDE
ncbi:MAG: lactonase family protein [Candidatus Sulfotelmatobacter sp.]